MTLTVNGETHETHDDQTIAGLLRQLGLDARPCAVEINRQLAPKSTHARRTLSDGDAIEIVTLVGGG